MRKIIIVYGGESNESDISKKTAQSIFENIDRSQFLPHLINYSSINFDENKPNSNNSQAGIASKV